MNKAGRVTIRSAPYFEGSTLGYYFENVGGGHDRPGQWFGDAALLDELSLTPGATVRLGETFSVLEGKHPGTGEPYVERMGLSDRGSSIRTVSFPVQMPDGSIEEREVKRNVKERLGTEVISSAPKSVSAYMAVLAAAGDHAGAEKVREAHRAAVAASFAYLQEHGAGVRRGAKGRDTYRADGLVGAAFEHTSSRPLPDGVGDPHLHTHMIISGWAKGPDGRWTKLDHRQMLRMVRASGSLYQQVLRCELVKNLSVKFTLPNQGSSAGEIIGVPQQLIDAWSKRRKELLVAATDAGVDLAKDSEAGQRLQTATRQEKKTLSFQEQIDAWSGELVELGYSAHEIAHNVEGYSMWPGDDWTQPIAKLEEGRVALKLDDEKGRVALSLGLLREGGDEVDVCLREDMYPRRSIEYVVARLTNFNTSFALNDLHRVLFDIGVAPEDINRIAAQVLSSDLVSDLAPLYSRHLTELMRGRDDEHGVGNDPHADARYSPIVSGRQRWTARDIRELERELFQIMKAEKRVERPELATETVDAGIGKANFLRELERVGLTEEHRQAASAMLAGAPISILSARAGTGKTSSVMKVVADVAAEAGVPVMGVAAEGKAAFVIHQESNIEAATIDKVFYAIDNKEYQLPEGVLMIVDEAAKAGTLKLHRLYREVEKVGGTLSLVGDPRQLQSIAFGGFFAEVVKVMPERVNRLTKVFRQEDQLEIDALNLIHEGKRLDEALAYYIERDGVKVFEDATAAKLDMVKWWCDWNPKAEAELGKSVALVSERNRERFWLNKAVQQERISRGELNDGFKFDAGTFFAGDKIAVRRNDDRISEAVKNGVTGEVLRGCKVATKWSTTVRIPAVRRVTRRYKTEPVLFAPVAFPKSHQLAEHSGRITSYRFDKQRQEWAATIEVNATRDIRVDWFQELNEGDSFTIKGKGRHAGVTGQVVKVKPSVIETGVTVQLDATNSDGEPYVVDLPATYINETILNPDDGTTRARGLELAYALTLSRSQGSTYAATNGWGPGLDDANSIYTSLSRGTGGGEVLPGLDNTLTFPATDYGTEITERDPEKRQELLENAVYGDLVKAVAKDGTEASAWRVEREAKEAMVRELDVVKLQERIRHLSTTIGDIPERADVEARRVDNDRVVAVQRLRHMQSTGQPTSDIGKQTELIGRFDRELVDLQPEDGSVPQQTLKREEALRTHADAVQEWTAATARIRKIANVLAVKAEADAPAHLTSLIGPKPSEEKQADEWRYQAVAVEMFKLKWGVGDEVDLSIFEPDSLQQQRELAQVAQQVGISLVHRRTFGYAMRA